MMKQYRQSSPQPFAPIVSPLRHYPFNLTSSSTMTPSVASRKENDGNVKNSNSSNSSSSNSNNNDEREMYNDLKSFLLSPRADLRIAATQAVVKTIQSDVGSAPDSENSSMSKLVRYGLILPLVQNISYSHDDDDDDDDDDDEKKKNDNKNKSSMDQVVAVNALKALVYLSSHGTSANQCIQDLLDAKCISRLLEIVLPAKNIAVPENSSSSSNETLFGRARINYALALMANLTRSEQGAIELVGKTLPERAVPSTRSKSSKDKKSTDVGTADDTAKEEEEDNNIPRIKPGMEILTARFLNPAFIQPNVDYKQLAKMAQEEVEEEEEGKDDKNNDNDNIIHTSSAAAAAALDSSTADPYQHFAAVLMNVTQVEQGRNFLLQLHYHDKDSKKDRVVNNTTIDKDTQDGEGTSVFQRLIPLIKTSPNPIRRRGLAGLIRNVCLDKDSAWWLLHVVHINRYILYPLAGPEALEMHEKQGLDVDLWISGPDKEREPDVTTRLFLVEALLLLCAGGRVARRRMRVMDKVPVILKWAEMVEEEEEVSERITDCIQYLRRDEEQGADEEDELEEDDLAEDDESASDDVVAKTYRNQLTITSGATSCPVVTTSAKGMMTTNVTTTTTITAGGKQRQGDAGEADFDNVD